MENKNTLKKRILLISGLFMLTTIAAYQARAGEMHALPMPSDYSDENNQMHALPMPSDYNQDNQMFHTLPHYADPSSGEMHTMPHYDSYETPPFNPDGDNNNMATILPYYENPAQVNIPSQDGRTFENQRGNDMEPIMTGYEKPYYGNN